MGTAHVVERMEVEPASLFYHEHVARYRFAAAQLFRGLTLDIATGAGYGADLLRKQLGGAVVGADIYPPALHKAREDYRAAQMHFVAASGTALPFDDKSFHNVVTLETLEHIMDDAGFLRELARVLRTDGVMVLSTPNHDHSLRHKQVNPFHVREYTSAELVSLLSVYFADVKLYYQGFASTYYDEVATYASSIQAEKMKLPAVVRFLLDHGYRPLKALIPIELTNVFIRNLLKLRYPQPDVTEIVITPEPPADPGGFIAVCRHALGT